MTINEFTEVPRRKIVGVLGGQPETAAIENFALRGFDLQPLSAHELMDSARLSTIDSVVFIQSANKPTRIHGLLEESARLLLNHDCRIYVRVAKSETLHERTRLIVVNSIRELRLPPANITHDEWFQFDRKFVAGETDQSAPYVYVCDTSVTWSTIANYVDKNPAGIFSAVGPEISAVDASGNELDLPEEHRLLIRRAFFDCDVVDLIQFTDGLSGVAAFRAFAKHSGPLGRSSFPYKFFVKIGDRNKIITEYKSYQGNALMYIPFHLGPRLNIERCQLGADKGIIVGDFVGEAESLKDCARDGRAGHVIANLFNKTLRAWHDLAVCKEGSSVPDLLLQGFGFPRIIPSHRESLIRRLGATHSLAQLRDRFERQDAKSVLVGPIHGDLHAMNVLVRSGDAIIIDFEKVKLNMPMLYDLASLEAGLLVDGFFGENPQRGVDAWMQSIRPLYKDGVDLKRSEPCHPKDGSLWFYDCVRQIRMHARGLEVEGTIGQYATTLAFCFIKKSCNENVFGDVRDAYRAAAFFIGETILLKLP